MVKCVVEPGECVLILVAMVRHVEGSRILRFQHDLRDRDLQHVEDTARVLAGFQQSC